ncbi:hypothetical protein FAZ69_23420 [Trinickia terrae]|uniref:Uncharacterized protein n=1 Tax=Trinickia terrae TaxID=2571161 RepID=A0A4U1HQ29_9BURK|nr:hypothetical protein [Trinickia terrae]TKC83442.1 hypothetical protein FAZ69_23420 [Trinickia terrae]
MARAASAPLILFPAPYGLLRSMERRRAYLRDLWEADVDPLVFRDAARRLGYVVRCQWDGGAGMPVLKPMLALLH